MNTFSRICLALVLVSLSACGGIERRDGPGKPTKVAKVPTVVPKKEPLSKYGNPPSYVVFGKRYHTLKTANGFNERGIASWYGKKFHGRKTSSGEVYDMYKMTAAHKHLPLPTFVKVKNLENGKIITVRVNDRGPFHDNRIIDLSYAAATKLGILGKGTAAVEIWAVDGGEPRYAEKRSEPALPTKRDLKSISTPEDLAANAAEVAGVLVRDEASLEQLIVGEFAKVVVESGEQALADVYLQIGAYKELQNARIALDRITRHIPFARIQEAESAGAIVYRVQVGPIADEQQVDHYVRRLVTLGFSEHHFIAP